MGLLIYERRAPVEEQIKKVMDLIAENRAYVKNEILALFGQSGNDYDQFLNRVKTDFRFEDVVSVIDPNVSLKMAAIVYSEMTIGGERNTFVGRMYVRFFRGKLMSFNLKSISVNGRLLTEIADCSS